MIHSIQPLTFELNRYHLFTMCGLRTIAGPNAHGVCLKTYDVMESHDTTCVLLPSNLRFTRHNLIKIFLLLYGQKIFSCFQIFIDSQIQLLL